MNKEIEWKDVPMYEGLYKANILGEVMSYGKTWKSGMGGIVRTSPPGLVPTRLNIRTGYLYISFCKDGSIKSFPLHRIIAITFHNQFNNNKL